MNIICQDALARDHFFIIYVEIIRWQRFFINMKASEANAIKRCDLSAINAIRKSKIRSNEDSI